MLLDDKCSDSGGLQEEDLYGAVDCWSLRPKTAVFRHLNSWKACSDLVLLCKFVFGMQAGVKKGYLQVQKIRPYLLPPRKYECLKIDLSGNWSLTLHLVVLIQS